MAKRTSLAFLFAALTCGLTAMAQPPWERPAPPPAPVPPGAVPLLYVKLLAPAGSRVTIHDGMNRRTFAAPVTVGLRPLVPCRFSVEGLRERDDEAVHGTIVVRDVLRLPPDQRAVDFPVPLLVTPKDLDHIGTAMIIKWLIIEDPNRLPSVQLTPGQPAELPNVAGDEPEEAADLLGRPVAIVYMGGREPDPDSLAGIPPGWVVFPEQAAQVPSVNDPRVLPIIQPPKGGEEVLKDGGDSDRVAHLDKTGQLSGVNPTDTVAEYRNHAGQKQMVVSNRVCVVAPRFVILRHVVPLQVQATVVEPTPMIGSEAGEHVDLRQKSRIQRQLDEADLVRRRDRLNANVLRQSVRRLVEVQPLAVTVMTWEPHIALTVEQAKTLTLRQRALFKKQVELALALTRVEGLGRAKTVVATEVAGQVEELGVVRAVFEPKNVTFVCEPDPQLPDQPLFIQKWASAESAKPGDILTFSILYKNVGGKPIREIAVVDSLSSRLEYLPGTAQSNREAVFLSQENEVGSLELRWEIKEPLLPNQHGVVKFQAKVK